MGLDGGKHLMPDEKRRKEIEQQIAMLSRQVEEMTSKIRAYLADRQHQPHPRHLEFIQKVQNFRISPDVTNRHLETLLDNLQWKVYYHQKSWKQLWENAESARNSNGPFSSDGDIEPLSGPLPDRDESSSSLYSIDNLWEIQKEKLKTCGIDSAAESRSQFKKRMISEYRELNRVKKRGQEIVMTFERDESRCTLKLKDK